jgi:hypothetical protein
MAAIDDVGSGRPRSKQAGAPAPVEHVRDQLFAAAGYAFAFAVLVALPFTPHVGATRVVVGVIVLGLLLTPVNVLVIRGHARLRRRYANVPARSRSRAVAKL